MARTGAWVRAGPGPPPPSAPRPAGAPRPLVPPAGGPPPASHEALTGTRTRILESQPPWAMAFASRLESASPHRWIESAILVTSMSGRHGQARHGASLGGRHTQNHGLNSIGTRESPANRKGCCALFMQQLNRRPWIESLLWRWHNTITPPQGFHLSTGHYAVSPWSWSRSLNKTSPHVTSRSFTTPRSYFYISNLWSDVTVYQ